MAVNADISHRLLDILSVVLLVGVVYLALRLTATKFDAGENLTVLAFFLGAVADKLGFRILHGKVK